MGCDIYSLVEVKDPSTGKWNKVGDIFLEVDSTDKYTDDPFCWRSYGLYGFLANVRNYSECEPISEPKGVPENLSTEGQSLFQEGIDDHSHSWLTLQELLNFNYEKEFTDKRRKSQGGPYNGTNDDECQVSYREFLGRFYFERLEILKALGKPEDVRLVFWFNG